MKGTKIYLPLFLLFSLLFSLSAQPSNIINVRGTPIELPFELKILSQEISSQGPDSITLSGMELRDDMGTLIKDETVRCEKKKSSDFILNLNKWADLGSWLCSSKTYQRLLDRRMSFSVRAGFIMMNESFYRGSIELIPKKEKILVINKIPVESYLAGLVNSEIHSKYPAEAIKAQIIAARSYALATAADRRKNLYSDFDLYNTESDQVYLGTTREDSTAFKYVKETAGQVLFHRENVLKSYYCSSIGSYSELPKNVWDPEFTQLDDWAYQAKRSPIDADLEGSKWSVLLSPKMGLAWRGVGLLREIKVLERTEGKRVKRIKLSGERGSQIISGTEFRKKFGAKWIKSTLFAITKMDSGWIIEGQGWGHGVGMSQLGARALAKLGKSARDILTYYYPFSHILVMNLNPVIKDTTLAPRMAIGAR